MGRMTQERRDLRAAGFTRFDGAPCKLGHGTERYVSSGGCVVCHALRTRKWLSENPEKWSGLFSKWRERNVERDRARCLTWQKQNPERARAGIAKRKATLLSRIPAWANADDIAAVYAEAGRISRESGVRHEVDHIVPLQGRLVCGLHVAENLRVITAEENRRKGNRLG